MPRNGLKLGGRMKDLLKTYAPAIFLILGFGGYWVYGQISILRAINTQLSVQMSQGCQATLEANGFQVIAPEDDGEETN